MRLYIHLLTAAIAVYAGLHANAEEDCQLLPIDFVLVMDESGSIGDANFKTALNAAAGLSRKLKIGSGPDESRAGMVLFNDVGRVAFGLDEYHTNADVAAAVRRAQYERGLTDIAAGMQTAIEVFKKAGQRNVHKIMVIVTDGMDTSDVGAQHNLASKDGITTYAFGIGNEIDMEELIRAAGAKERVFTADSYLEFAKQLDKFCIPKSQNGPRGCECNFSHTWLDLVFIIDSSKAVNREDFLAVRNFVGAVVNAIPVSQQIGKFSRVAVINMGDQAQIISDLTTFKSSDEAAAAVHQMPYLNSNEANLRDAMIKAQNMINNDERPNVQNVVVVFSSKDELCAYQGGMKLLKAQDQNPCRIAAHLRETNTIVMTVGLKYDGSQKYPTLKIASPCYDFKFDAEMSANFQDAMCRANCYCLQPYVQFTDQCTEYGECVYQQGQPLGYFIAQETCSNYNATLIDVLNAQKDAFIRNMQEKFSYVPYWIGAQCSANGCKWDSGTKFGPNDYKNWAPQQPNLQVGDCVYEEKNAWYSNKCDFFSPAHYFLCQKKACDTENYCDFEKN